MFAAARIGDPITHDQLVPCGAIGPSMPVPCPNCAAQPVIIEGLPAAHVNCTCVCTGVITGGLIHPPPPAPPPPPIVIGSPTVLIHNMPAARWTPSLDIGGCGVFLGDPKLVPIRTVFIGGVGAPPPPPPPPSSPPLPSPPPCKGGASDVCIEREDGPYEGIDCWDSSQFWRSDENLDELVEEGKAKYFCDSRKESDSSK